MKSTNEIISFTLPKNIILNVKTIETDTIQVFKIKNDTLLFTPYGDFTFKKNVFLCDLFNETIESWINKTLEEIFVAREVE